MSPDKTGMGGRRPGYEHRAMTFRWGGKALSAVRWWLARHPRVTLALKTALAAALSWLLVQPLWGVADEYPYYAPLGAVIAVSGTVAGSVRESLHGLAAILLGAAIALAVRPLPMLEVVSLAVVVAIGTIVGGWQRIAGMASWVPLSALYVLIIGRTDPMDYVICYAGLTSLGAAVGIGVNLALPPLPLSPTQQSVTRLRDTLAGQLDDLADGLLHEGPPSAEEWDDRRRSIQPVTSQMREMVEQAGEARRANWRAGRWRERADRQYQQARALEQLAFLVEDVTAVVVDNEQAEQERVALGEGLRPYAAHAMEEMADALRSVDGSSADTERLADVDEALERLVEEIRSRRRRNDDDLFAAGTIVTTLRRALESLVPDDLSEELPREW
jgi:uncharacterized membrane protein YgaE (UPF0421/DUF939 family)